MVAVAEASRDNAGRRGKIRCRPQIAFLRENLVRRVARRSPQFSAPTFECRRRAPTNEGCRRSCPVHPDAWPDNREFLAPEMEVEGRQAHIWESVVRLVAIDVPRNFRCCDANTNYLSPPLARVSIPPLKMRSPEKISVRARTRIGIGFENASEDNFVLPSWQIFSRRCRANSSRGRRGQFCPRSDVHLPYRTGCRSSGELAAALILRARRSIAAARRRAGRACARVPRTPGGSSSPRMRRE